jgi:hypothetical protein
MPEEQKDAVKDTAAYQSSRSKLRNSGEAEHDSYSDRQL